MCLGARKRVSHWQEVQKRSSEMPPVPLPPRSCVLVCVCDSSKSLTSDPSIRRARASVRSRGGGNGGAVVCFSRIAAADRGALGLQLPSCHGAAVTTTSVVRMGIFRASKALATRLTLLRCTLHGWTTALGFQQTLHHRYVCFDLIPTL